MSFQLHPDLQRAGIPMGRFELCQVLLINDRAYPWFVLVPERNEVRMTIDLSPEDHDCLWVESRIFGTAIMSIFDGQNLNVAALGNMTPQLHVHHVVRYHDDAAWPGPIWGSQPISPRSSDDIQDVRKRLAAAQIAGFQAISE